DQATLDCAEGVADSAHRPVHLGRTLHSEAVRFPRLSDLADSVLAVHAPDLECLKPATEERKSQVQSSPHLIEGEGSATEIGRASCRERGEISAVAGAE